MFTVSGLRKISVFAALVAGLSILPACPAWMSLDWNQIDGEYLGEWRSTETATSEWIESQAQVQKVVVDPVNPPETESATFEIRIEKTQTSVLVFKLTRNLQTSELGVGWTFPGATRSTAAQDEVIWLRSLSTKKNRDRGGCLVGTLDDRAHPETLRETLSFTKGLSLPDAKSSFQKKNAVSVCLHLEQLSFTLADGIRFHLTKKTALPQTGPSPVPTVLLTREEFQKKVLNQGFDEKIRIQRLYQSFIATQQSYTSVLPKISVSDVIGIFTQPQFSILRLIGNWTPFLFPGKWIRIKGSMERLEVDRLSQVLGSANWAYTADGLALNWLRDQEIRGSVERWLPFFESYLKRIQTDEKLGLELPGTSLDWESAVLSLRRASAILDQGLQIQSVGMREATGGESVTGIAPIGPGNFTVATLSESALEQETAWVKARVLATAPEIRQMDASIREARAEKRARTWDWIDPTSAGSGLNFGTFVSIRAQKAQIQTLELMKQALVERLRKDLDSWEVQIRSSLKLWKISSQALTVSQTKMKRLETGLKLGIRISPLEVRILGPELMRLESEEIQTRYEFEALWERRSRLLMEGVYGDLLSQRKP